MPGGGSAPAYAAKRPDDVTLGLLDDHVDHHERVDADRGLEELAGELGALQSLGLGLEPKLDPARHLVHRWVEVPVDLQHRVLALTTMGSYCRARSSGSIKTTRCRHGIRPPIGTPGRVIRSSM
jgi:hypothetical protein